MRTDGVDPSTAVGLLGVAALAIPIVGEIELGAVAAALGHAALARAIAVAPAIPGLVKMVGEGLGRNPNGPPDTLHWALDRFGDTRGANGAHGAGR
ncbi:MAG: hypothetical protein NVS3B10_20040 [Polyangiales bacterium]